MEFVCELLADDHDLSLFGCGEPELDDWLKKSAHHSDGRRITKTYVFHRGDGVVVGYYAVMPFILERQRLSRKEARGLPGQVPGFLIAKLALSVDLQGERLGSHLLASACGRAARAAEEVGGRFIIVDAISPSAASFYEHHGFRPVPGHQERLVLPARDVWVRLSSREL